MISIVAEYRDAEGDQHVMFTTNTIERAKEIINEGGWVQGREDKPNDLETGWTYRLETVRLEGFDSWHAKVRHTGASYRVYAVVHKD
jgi:hypothetical protein